MKNIAVSKIKMLNKRGLSQNAVMESFGLLLAAILILGILVKLMFPTGTAIASTEKSFDSLQENLIRAEREGPFSLENYPLSIEKSVWFVGFSKFEEKITDSKGNEFLRPLEECPSASLHSCLCLCKDKCNEVIKCNVFEDFDNIRKLDGSALVIGDSFKNLQISHVDDNLLFEWS